MNEEHVAASFRFIVIVIPLYFMQTTVRHPGQNRLESPRNFVSLNAVSTEFLHWKSHIFTDGGIF